ncbi:expansin-A23-like [Rosa sericea]
MAMLKYLLTTASVFISLLVPGMRGDDMTTWFTGAHASLYGDMQGRGTMEGECGYGDLNKREYNLQTAALSKALFNDGLACGACFAIMCVDDKKGCKPSAGSAVVTATDYCPPIYTKPPNGTNNWCNPPLKHFKLSMPMFTRIAEEKVGVVPVVYRRVPCAKGGGVKFQLFKGNSNLMRVLLYNVAGAGDVSNVKIKGSIISGWLQMSRIQGQTWEIGTDLQGQSLSFQVTTSDGKMVEFDNAVDKTWQFGETFDGIKNF